MRNDDLQSHNSNNWFHSCTTFSSLQQNPIARWTSCHRQNLTLYTTNKEAKFLFSPVPFSSLLLSSLSSSLSLSFLVLSLPFIFFSSVRHAMSWTLHSTPIPYQAFGLTSSRVCISMKRQPSSQLWKQIFVIGSLWVVAQRRKQRVMSKLLEKLNAEFYREREREWRI